MALFKRIVKAGNSYSIRLDKTLLEVMDITEKTPLRIDVNTNGGNQIIITPVREESDDFNRAFEQAFGELKGVLGKMPDVPVREPRGRTRKKVDARGSKKIVSRPPASKRRSGVAKKGTRLV